MKNLKVIIPDTSIIIQGILSDLIKKGELKNIRLVIPRAVVDELQAQASRGKDIGFEGLEEIKKIRDLAPKRNIKLEFYGDRPTLEEIQLAKKGRIDAIIRDVAVKENGTLVTSDYVQALVGEAEGVSVKHMPQPRKTTTDIEKFFTKDTQSVHLKVGLEPMAKRGNPGSVKLVKISKNIMSEKELKGIIDEIIQRARTDENSFVEIGKHGAMVIQMGNYRILITRPPFSEATEVTAVRPIVKLSIDDYELHDELKARISNKSQGVLIAGPPGSGKSTFAASIAEFLSGKGKIVKTLEQPRDLQVGPEITQYAPLEGDWEKATDILLLVRPDYTIFDEIRKTREFRLFGDMRLAGVGMIGVVHANDPVSAIQRFIGRLELGIIPHVINTVIFIDAGKVQKVYELSFNVRVPSGMKEADLARPVVDVKDFETKELVYEIYTFGEESVVMSVKNDESSMSGIKKLAMDRAYQELRKWDNNVKIEILDDNRICARVDNEKIARIIGKKGKNIEEIEKKLGIHISVEPKEATFKNEVQFYTEEMGKHFYIKVDPKLSGKSVDIYDNEAFLMTSLVGKSGKIRIKKKSDIGRNVMRAITKGALKILM
ncbi:MAG: PINc/VapC family ATPase [Nanoarchaeota archaeon]